MIILPSGGTSENKFRGHAFQHEWLSEGQKFYTEHPVCPRCERVALRDKGWAENRIARCPQCGWSGRAPMILKEYIKEKLYRR